MFYLDILQTSTLALLLPHTLPMPVLDEAAVLLDGSELPPHLHRLLIARRPVPKPRPAPTEAKAPKALQKTPKEAATAVEEDRCVLVCIGVCMSVCIGVYMSVYWCVYWCVHECVSVSETTWCVRCAVCVVAAVNAVNAMHAEGSVRWRLLRLCTLP